MDPGRASTQEKAWHFKGLRTSERCFRWLLRLPAPHPASPRREQGGEAKNHRSCSTPMPRHPCFGLPFKNAKPDKGDKIPRSRATGGVLSRQGWWSPEKSSPSAAEGPGPRWSLQMGEAGLSQRYTLCCRAWGWGRNSGCHSTVVRKGQRTPWECSVTA